MEATETPINLRESILNRVKAECADAIPACSLPLAQHREMFQEYTRRCLLPGQAESAIKHLTETRLLDPSPERLSAHARVLAELYAIHKNTSIQFEARRSVVARQMEVEKPAQVLKAAVLASLDRQIAELVESETRFFASVGLPHSETAVSQVATSLRAGLEAHPLWSDRWKQHPASDATPSVDVSGLEWLFR